MNKPYVDPQALSDTVAAVKAQRELGNVTFSLHSKSIGGFRMQSETGAISQNGQPDQTRKGKFTLETDEPASLLGSDKATSPAEYVLQSLAGCYGVTIAANAAQRKIELNHIKLDLECDIDLAGFLGLDKAVRPGLQQLRVNVELDSPNASREQLQELIEAVQKSSPIRDTLANPVEVVTTLR
jgi:putative redox protein